MKKAGKSKTLVLTFKTYGIGFILFIKIILVRKGKCFLILKPSKPKPISHAIQYNKHTLRYHHPIFSM